MFKSLSVVILGVGVALLGISVIWSQLFSGASGWTDEKQIHKDEVGMQVREIAGELTAAQTTKTFKRGRTLPQIEAEYKKAKATLDALQDDFTDKTQHPRGATYSRWAGILFIAVGAVAMMASRNG